ncbi:MAG: hypothetical protein IJV29_13215 [Butyrivibrio sp.]|nr:hypothetical protein [Butyrivibrio sp.]
MDDKQILDRIKASAFVYSNTAFLGIISCMLTLDWKENHPEVREDFNAGIFYQKKLMLLKKDWFLSLPKKQQTGVFLHELWHAARLHDVRLGDRDPVVWNIAGDYRINNDLLSDGFELPPDCLQNSKYTRNISEEEIYDDIYHASPKSRKKYVQQLSTIGQDVQQVNEEEKLAQVMIVQQAIQQMKVTGAGKIPGDIEKVLSNYLKPKLPWWRLLRNYLTDSLDIEWSWKRPNKRFRDIYLPSITKEEGKLTHVVLFLDTSGSISDKTLERFNSEVRFIQEVLCPEKLTVIQFDYTIQKVQEWKEGQRYRKIKMYGGGGTSLHEVHDWIVKNTPTCAIIFSDLWCEPMEPVKVPVIWIIEGDHEEPQFGKSFRI